MFRRRASFDSDAVSLAQRRLAALAEHLAPARVPGKEVPDETSVSDREVPDETSASDRSAEHNESVRAAATVGPRRDGRLPGVGAGRHRGHPRSSELGQWSVNRNHVLVMLIAVAAVLIVAGWTVLRALPHSQPVRLVSSRSTPARATPGSADGSAPVLLPTDAATPVGAASTPTQTLVVDVAGKVRRPGIVELPAGARVVDALEAAGGVRSDVDTTNLNLARVLVDGEQIVVGSHAPSFGQPPASTATTSSTSSDAGIAPVNINTATEQELEALPDVGPVTAQSIIDYRTQSGGFTSVDQLIDVSGIGDATLADLRPYVYV